jgi:cobalt/nickel transport system permease protein
VHTAVRWPVSMTKIENRFSDIGRMDTLAAGDSALHRLDPRSKLITTLVFIVAVVSFEKYAVSALIPYFIYPVILISASGLSAGYLLRKVLLVSPFAILIGIFNPLIDQDILFHFGSIGIPGGWVSFFSIMMRFALTVTAAMALVSLTGFNAVCLALARLHVPKPFVVQLLFLYRYLFVLTDEAARMVRAKSLRSFDSGATSFRVFVSVLGHLLLRTLDRAQRIHLAMCCRGFDGQIRIISTMRVGAKDVGFMLGWSALFVLFRYYNIPMKLGTLVTGYFK